MSPRAVLVAIAALALGVSARAAELAPGLSYVRSADASVIVTALESGSVVLDLRTVTDEVKPLRVPRTRLLLVLVSPDTPARAFPGAITIGRIAPELQTDIAVTTTAEADAAAITALAAGASPEKLIVENADKPRFDESLLVRGHHAGAAPSEPDAPAEADAMTSDAPAKPPVVIDSVLQRAVHIYRGLIALNKIPAP